MTLKSVTKIIKLLGIEHNDSTVAGAMRATKKSGWSGNFTRSSRQISLACRSSLSYPTFRTGRWQLQYVEPHQFLLRCYELQDGRYARGIGSTLSPLGGIWKGVTIGSCMPKPDDKQASPFLDRKTFNLSTIYVDGGNLHRSRQLTALQTKIIG
ncbi:hypothetical protein PGTUg99_010750 [Puccinia graminis f. sp. tritici]|uniref:Uncharacterized protein n=1 Tax=Puccinia graminis f. sp. tritici TaxID=56615 RepID=A0A5B0RD67_PUCGR|nr:hypothetical protein PGTUg99_010750 [Puccinia graminis f. sp. tritici]